MASPLTRTRGTKVDRNLGPEQDAIILRFGGGLHTRASEEDINDREAADGQNFLLDQENHRLRNRPSFDLIDTAGNGGEIRGFVNLLKSDGTIAMAVQAGDTVYSFDGSSLGSSIASVSSSARLRGTLESQWTLDDKVLISDLALQQPVMEWDGSTFQNITEDLAGTFKARYCFVAGERAVYANVESNSIATPHLIAFSEVEDYGALSVADKPSSALGADDPFYLLAPDLRPINGIVEAFGATLFSSRAGSVYKLLGSSAKDYALDPLYAWSAAVGDEAFTFVGNDIVYGRQGRIESVVATDQFGDVQADDITVPIADRIMSVNDWIIVYNSRLQRVYFFDKMGAVWVYNKNLASVQAGISPWSKWVTTQASNFQPTAAMRCLDPGDGLEYVFMGDSAGNLYRLEGSGTSGDAGSASVRTEFLSKLFTAQIDAQMFNLTGWLKYRAGAAQTVNLSFEFAGEAVFNESITLSLPAVGYTTVYGGPAYYGGAFHYGAPFEGRLTRTKFGPPGRSNELQIRVSVEGTKDFDITEIGLRFEKAGTNP
jgi:hypothetical protein